MIPGLCGLVFSEVEGIALSLRPTPTLQAHLNFALSNRDKGEIVIVSTNAVDCKRGELALALIGGKFQQVPFGTAWSGLARCVGHGTARGGLPGYWWGLV